MEIIKLPLSQLIPADYNPRVELPASDPRYRKLRRSVERFGLVEPLIWNRRTNRLVGGHQRWRILRDLGETEVSVSVVDLSEEQEKALNVVLNNRSAQSDWDLKKLTAVLEELAALPQSELPASGFDSSQLEWLRSQLAPVERPPEPPAPRLVEIVLSLPAERLEELRPELDRLIDRHGLTTQLRFR